jgi:hypothetical protein
VLSTGWEDSSCCDLVGWLLATAEKKRVLLQSSSSRAIIHVVPTSPKRTRSIRITLTKRTNNESYKARYESYGDLGLRYQVTMLGELGPVPEDELFELM